MRPLPETGLDTEHTCKPFDMEEVSLSDCEYGCKNYKCCECNATKTIHSSTYGCPTGRRVEQTQREDELWDEYFVGQFFD